MRVWLLVWHLCPLPHTFRHLPSTHLWFFTAFAVCFARSFIFCRVRFWFGVCMPDRLPHATSHYHHLLPFTIPCPAPSAARHHPPPITYLLRRHVTARRTTISRSCTFVNMTRILHTTLHACARGGILFGFGLNVRTMDVWTVERVTTLPTATPQPAHHLTTHRAFTPPAHPPLRSRTHGCARGARPRAHTT